MESDLSGLDEGKLFVSEQYNTCLDLISITVKELLARGVSKACIYHYIIEACSGDWDTEIKVTKKCLGSEGLGCS